MSLHRQLIYRGSTMTRGVLDVRQSRVNELAAVDGVTSLSNAVTQARTGLPASRTVDGVAVPLARVSARRLRDDKALVNADYSFYSGGSNEGFDRIHLRTGWETVQWVQLTVDANGVDKQFDANGMPSGANNQVETADGGMITRPYPLLIPTWTILVRTILNDNPANAISIYQQKQINSNNVMWDEFSIPAESIRFDRADIDYRGDQYFVTYIFTVRQGPWVKQVVQNNTAVIATMYDQTSFTAPGFPVAA